MYYADLTPCDYFRSTHPDLQLRAMGWLEPGHDYHQGPTDPRMPHHLKMLFGTAWPGATFCGGHTCGFCLQATGYLDLFIPGDHINYAVPELILHYVNAHQYQPLQEFWDAMLVCPPIGSPEYFAALEGPTGS